MTPRSIAVQGVGAPPLGLASQGFVGVLVYVPLFAVWIRAELRRVTFSSAQLRMVRIPLEARGIRIPPDPGMPEAVFHGGIRVPAEVRQVSVAGDPRLILMPGGA